MRGPISLFWGLCALFLFACDSPGGSDPISIDGCNEAGVCQDSGADAGADPDGGTEPDAELPEPDAAPPMRGDSPPAGPCQETLDCAEGECRSDLPGGFCAVNCAADVDCAPDAECLFDGTRNRCQQPCNDGCRVGWLCNDESFCEPSCMAAGCSPGLVCGADGACTIPVVSITMEQIFIAPGKADGSNWDGTGRVPPEATALVAAALGAPGPVAGLLSAFSNGVIASLAKPDVAGEASLTENGGYGLPKIQDSFTPLWDGVVWDNVYLDPNQDIRLTLTLWDEDLANDDPIGLATVTIEDMQQALESGQSYPVRVDDQGAGQILLISISVRAQR